MLDYEIPLTITDPDKRVAVSGNEFLALSKEQELPFACQLVTDMVLLVAAGNSYHCMDDNQFSFELEVIELNEDAWGTGNHLECHNLDFVIHKTGCGLKSAIGGLLAANEPIICGGNFRESIQAEPYECYLLKGNHDIMYLDSLRSHSASIVLGDTLFITGGFPK